MIDRIYHNETLQSIIIRSSYQKEGIEFFTPDDFSQQLGYMKRPSGHLITPHMHLHAERKITLTQEVLYIKSGKVRVDFYDGNKTFIESRVLESGDVILLATGGHGFEVLEEAEMIEIKQGPFSGNEDKVTFNATNTR